MKPHSKLDQAAVYCDVDIRKYFTSKIVLRMDEKVLQVYTQST